MGWLVSRVVRRAVRRLVLAGIGVAFPVGMLAATLLLIDDAVHAMTPVALAPVQIEMRAMATSLDVDMSAVTRDLAAVPGVRRAERFASADVSLQVPGRAERVPARLFAVDPAYLANHPWVRVETGRLGDGVLLNPALRALPGFAGATAVDVLPAGAPPPADQPAAPADPDEPAAPPTAPVVTSGRLAVDGAADLRAARFWFEIPYGEVLGDVAAVPRAVVVSYATFERSVLPAIRAAGPAALNPAATDLAPVSLETHIGIDHGAYPTDPARALRFSTALRRTLERQSPSIVVADGAGEPLTVAREDATNAKILFLLLGIPGALVAGGLGLAAANALAEAQRREEALLELRGATRRQLAWLTAVHAAVAGTVGAVVGVLVAVLAVGALVGRATWQQIPPERLATSMLIAVSAGLLTIAVRVVPLVRAARRSEVLTERRVVEPGRRQGWRQSRLDLLALGIGIAILTVNAAAGGLRQTPIEGQTLALAFYVLLAPIALWLGATLLVVRGLAALLVRWSRPTAVRPLTSWATTSVRWLGRRPARTAVALILGALAIAFGANVVTFVATYQAARAADAKAAFGADLRLSPPAEAPVTAPPTNPGLAAVSAVREIGARIGTDRKSILAIDPATHQRTATAEPIMLDGPADALTRDPNATLILKELADDFELAIGDTLTLVVYPDDENLRRNLKLRVAGVFRSFPPTEPLCELVISSAALPAPLPPPDFYLARVAVGHPVDKLVAQLRGSFTVQRLADLRVRETRSLTTLNLKSLSRLESVAAALVAAVGVGVLGAFLVLERRREAAILRSIGATDRQIVTGPAIEGAIAILGSLTVGIPIGIGLSVVSIRVLGLFFVLPPPLAVVPTGALAALAGFAVLISTLAMVVALRTVARQAAAGVLREP